MVLLVVKLMAPMVRPWKPPWKTMMLVRPVAWRASLMDASTASAPLLEKKKVSSPAGTTSRSFSANFNAGG